MAKKGQKFKTYTREEKIKAVKMYLEEKKSMREIEQGYLGHKKCTGCVARWVVEFKQEGEENAFKKEKGMKKVENEAEMRYEILKKFNAFLDKEIRLNSNGDVKISEYMSYIIKCKDLKLPEVRTKKKNSGKYKARENINEELYRYNNIAENIKINNINQVITTDTTEYKLEIDGKQNVSFIADAYSGEIIVSSIGKRLNNEFISYNLDLLRQTRYDFKNIIIHSDRGGMYKSSVYKRKTTNMNLIQSMSAPFTYTHNPWIETINGQFKDFIKINIPKTLDELQIALNQFVYYNNNIKIKRKLKMTPIQYRHHFS